MIPINNAIRLPARANRVGRAAGGIGSSIAPAVSAGIDASTRPCASMIAEMPVGVARMTGRPYSIARIRACARCSVWPQ